MNDSQKIPSSEPEINYIPSKVKTHKQLAMLIKGKSILHSNSMGKDSVLCLEWLVKQARPKRIISLHFEQAAMHPGDNRYMQYLKKRFPSVEFFSVIDPMDITFMIAGIYQTPTRINSVYRKFEYNRFSRSDYVKEFMSKHDLDFVCRGESKYESFSRASKFHRHGLVFNGEIFPLGLMSKSQVWDLIKESGLKIHPCYKFTVSSYDTPSYWKMRNGIVSNPDYWKSLVEVWPLLECDKFRYEILMKKKSGEARCR